MIEFRDVSKAYQEKIILDHFFLKLEETKSCIFGESGVGKTTLLRLIAGLEKADSGKIIGAKKLRKSYVFQENRLLPWATALDNLTLFVNEKSAKQWMDCLGLADSFHLYPRQMSGGMCRRLAMARALASPFDLLLLDEPGKELDGKWKERIYKLINENIANRSLVLISHDRKEAKELCERFIMVEGRPLQIKAEADSILSL